MFHLLLPRRAVGLAFVLAVLAGCGGAPARESLDGGSRAGQSAPPAAEPPAEERVVFEVVGADGASSVSTLTYMVGLILKQESGVPLPYTKEVTGAGFPLSLIAQNAGTAGGITCRIKVGERVLREAQGSGPYGVCNVRADQP